MLSMPKRIRLEKLIEICNPMDTPPWGFRKIRREEIQKYIDANDLQSEPYSDSFASTWRRKDHIRRIAYLVVNRSKTSIELDVGIPELGYYGGWPIIDGNHRVVAAIFRNDKMIPVAICGSISHARELFCKKT